MYPMGAAEPRRGIICKTTGVGAAVEAGLLLEKSMTREYPTGQKKGVPLSRKAVTHGNAKERVEGGEAFFLYDRALCKWKEAGTMPSAARGAASPWFLVRAQKPADGESEPN